MKAIRIHGFGGEEVMRCEDVPVPTPKADEILIRVRAASVNPVDYKIREGSYPPVGDDALPFVMGRDMSGVVEDCGMAVEDFRAGDEVYAMLATDRGTFAEFALLRTAEAAPKPRSLSHVEAAAIPLAGLTAWQGLFDCGELTRGQRVLIHGGGGGVGHFAIQFAKVRGATVATTVSGDDLALAHELGADEVVDYRSQRFEDLTDPVDLVFDLIGGETQERSWSVLRPGGTLVSTLGEPSQEQAHAHQARGVGFMVEPNAAQLGKIADLIDAGRVRPVLDSTFPLVAASEATRHQKEQHVQGKVVIDLAA